MILDSTNVRQTFDQRSTNVRQTFDKRSTNVRQTFNKRSTNAPQTFDKRSTIQVKYQSGASASGSVTFIASYHYVRIFNSWVDAYAYSTGSPMLTGVPLYDAYQYMDWLLTVPLLLIVILLVMKLSDA